MKSGYIFKINRDILVKIGIVLFNSIKYCMKDLFHEMFCDLEKYESGTAKFSNEVRQKIRAVGFPIALIFKY
ncbi:hypothetical protein [Clostridium beijerinckii]|nr:hypothetical protein [Clostridium beijerinckii]MZK53607.1 hypothetical protein [Clostridium beijerinckii]MZK61712.1 hypothetical protein [Clostridium beijerinckii]MZK71474.1 hypothetical protein [Clostridium beijerinckii]MZK85541.1 hypothetical protein [Clostridium beijerinckii]MZL11613.1 hypothetical protein [Clostridium beijerinckii]